MTLPERADYSLTESALSPFPTEPEQRPQSLAQRANSLTTLVMRFEELDRIFKKEIDKFGNPCNNRYC